MNEQKKPTVAVTAKDLEWLNSCGGRTAEHVLIDEQGRKYVEMGHPSGKERVYLPV